MLNIGQVLVTPRVMAALTEAGQFPEPFLDRHINGDWGDLDEEDKSANNWAVDNEARILSAYHTEKGQKIWIITEADRSATTLLLPDEY